MPGTGKNDESTEQVPRGNRKPTSIKPLRPLVENSDKRYNDLTKFPSENPYPILRIHKDGTVLYANKASEPFLMAKGTAVGLPAPPEWHRLAINALSSGQVIREENTLNGRVFSFRAVPITENDYVNFYGTDITEQKTAQEEREITIKLLSLINSRNQIHDLMKLVTGLLKDWSGCEAVGIRLQEGEDFPYFETNGFPDEFVQAENKLCSWNELGEPLRDSQGRVYLECMCGNIISGRFDPSKPFFTKHGSFWSNCTTALLAGTTSADRMAKTRNRCNAAGYESVALVPLRTGEETFGLLQFNSKQKNKFTPEKISLLEHLADNLAIGLAQRKTEQALRESEKRFSSLFENMVEGFAYCKILLDKNKRTTDFIYLDVNNAFEKLTGLKNVEGKKVTEVIPGIKESNPELFDIYGRVALTGKPERFEDYIPALGIWFSVSAYSPAKEHFVAIFSNITERKLAEEAIRVSEDKFRHVFDYSAIGKSITFPSGEMQVNKAFCKMLGYSQAELQGKKWQELTHPDDIDDSQKAIGPLFSAKKDSVQFVKRYVHKNGSAVWADVSISLRRDSEGKPLYFMTTMVDITERKRAEEALRKNREDLDRAQAVGNIGSWRMDILKNELTWSDENHRIFGIPKGTPMTYETFLSTVHPDDRDYVDKKWKAGLAGEDYDIEHRILVDSRVKWVREKAYL